MSIYTIFETSSDLETGGIFVDYGQNEKGEQIRFKIARAGGRNKEFSKTLERLTKPFRKAIQSGVLDNKTSEGLYMQAFIESVLLGWQGVTGKDGKELGFSVENARTLLEDLPDLYIDLREQANQAALFKENIMEVDLGNSGKS